MIILTLAMVLIIGIATLAIDAGLSFVDQRSLQKASDLAALGGAGAIGAGGFTSTLQTTVLKTAQAYAWQNVNATAPAVTCDAGSGQLIGNTCTVSGTNYTISATFPYTPQFGQHYPADNSVAVDITHNFSTSGFSHALGVVTPCVGAQYSGGNTCVRTHAAAVAKSSSSIFPYALATRYLEVQGSAGVTAYGASLIYQCGGDGSGNFWDNSANGGIFTNGGSHFTIGQATSDGTTVTSPAALLLSDPTGVNCSGVKGNQDVALTGGWNALHDNVCFLASCSGYNPTFGFNYGPPDTNWDDHCWQDSGGSLPLLTSASPPSFNASTGVITAGSPAPAPCTRAGNPPSYEGSFPNSSSPGFPDFESPSGILSTSLGINAPTHTYLNVTPPDGLFSPGWYVFDGVNSSISGSHKTIGCSKPTASDKIQGCVFTFQNGANLSLGQGTVSCSPTATTGPCSFEFKAPTGAQSDYLAFTTSTDVNLQPITVTQVDPATGNTVQINVPIIFSDDNTICIGPGKPPGAQCAVVMSNSGTYNLGGTIFVPFGVVNFKANAAPSSGQLIADTVLLDGGSGSIGSAVAYKGAVNAPIPGPAALFE